MHKTYVSTFTDLYFESSGVQSDADIYIERLVDYLLGDTDRDGLIETAQGEVFDYDGDGNPPYDHETGTFDEDDWGDLDYYDDDFNNINSGYPGDSYIIFDYNFDNHVDIDLNYDPGNLEVDGTDLDNQGLFDGIDVNDDGDMDDWVSIDEKICLSLRKRRPCPGAVYSSSFSPAHSTGPHDRESRWTRTTITTATSL